MKKKNAYEIERNAIDVLRFASPVNVPKCANSCNGSHKTKEKKKKSRWLESAQRRSILSSKMRRLIQRNANENFASRNVFCFILVSNFTIRHLRFICEKINNNFVTHIPLFMKATDKKKIM